MNKIFAKDIVVLDVTSRLITAIVGTKKAQSVFAIKSLVEKDYSGFADGEWFNEREVFDQANAALIEATVQAKTKAKRLFVGVPGEFVTIKTKHIDVELDRLRKVNDQDIQYLLDKGNDFERDKYDVIGTSAIYYQIEGDENFYFDIRGKQALRINGYISYILCKKEYCELFEKIGDCAGYKDVRFLSLDWANGLNLFERVQRSEPLVLINVGYLTTAVSLIRGEGIIDMKSFSQGAAHISADICQYLDVPFDMAEKARELVDLNLNYSEHAVLVGDSRYTIYAQDAADIARHKLQEFAQVIDEVIKIINVENNSAIPVYITGEGVSFLRGANKYLSELIGKNIKIISPRLVGFEKPEHSSKISLLTVAETLNHLSFEDVLNFFITGGKK